MYVFLFRYVITGLKFHIILLPFTNIHGNLVKAVNHLTEILIFATLYILISCDSRSIST